MRVQVSIALFALSWAALSSALHVEVVKRDPESSLGVSDPHELRPVPVVKDLIKTVAVVAEPQPTTEVIVEQPPVLVGKPIVEAPKREEPKLDAFDLMALEVDTTPTIEQIYFSDPNYVHIGGGPPPKEIDVWYEPNMGNGVDESNMGIIYDVLDVGRMYHEFLEKFPNDPRVVPLKNAEWLYTVRGKVNSETLKLLKQGRILTAIGSPDFLNPWHPSYEMAKRMVANGQAISDIPDMIAVH